MYAQNYYVQYTAVVISTISLLTTSNISANTTVMTKVFASIGNI